MIACDTIRAAVMGLLVVLVLLHVATWPVVLAVSVVDSAANVLFDPSAMAALPAIVADEQLEPGPPPRPEGMVPAWLGPPSVASSSDSAGLCPSSATPFPTWSRPGP